jgi:DNA replication protein DnaC
MQMSDEVTVYWRVSCDCPAVTEERNRQLAEQKHQEKQAAYGEIVSRAGGIDAGRYARMTFENWDIARHGLARKHLGDVIEYTETYSRERNLLWLWGGEYGVGKTHLAVSALRKMAWDAIDAGPPNLSVRFVEWVLHCSRVQQSWDKSDNPGPTEGQLWRGMNYATFLVIDDIDKRMPSEWALGKLYEVIHYRYMYEKPLIITANHSLDDLADVWRRQGGYVADIGGALLSRLTGQLWAQVQVVGPDQRAVV